VKIEQALVLYLLKYKYVSLQGIGSFKIEETIPEHPETDKTSIIPPGAITFTPDPRTREDNELINFIVENTKKIRPLASADLDSFLALGKQFLNIGKPFTIQNLGTIEKSNSGVLSFTSGPLIQRPEVPSAKIEDAGAEQFEEESQGKPGILLNQGNKKGLFGILIIVLLALAAWAIWHFAFQKNNTEIQASNAPIVPISDSAFTQRMDDSLALVQKIAESARIADSLKKVRKNPADSFTFKVVVKETKNKQAALARLEKLKNYGRYVIMYTRDSITYKIAHPFMLPLSDTTKVLDSLNSYYYLGKAHIEIK
jgi:hypothetical protein